PPVADSTSARHHTGEHPTSSVDCAGTWTFAPVSGLSMSTGPACPLAAVTSHGHADSEYAPGIRRTETWPPPSGSARSSVSGCSVRAADTQCTAPPARTRADCELKKTM